MGWISTPCDIPGLKILASGSKGNCVILEHEIALDMGVPFKTIRPYIYDFKCVFISHAHGDHFKPSTVRRIAELRPAMTWLCGAWLVPALEECGVRRNRIVVLSDGVNPPSWHTLNNGFMMIKAVPLLHDLPNIGCRFRLSGWGKVFYAVDTASLDGIIAPNYDLYLVEANYDNAKLRQRIAEKTAAGEYCYEKRVIYTHMDTADTLSWLYDNMGKRSKYVLLHMHEYKEEE